jgi:hypothetical protein
MVSKNGQPRVNFRQNEKRNWVSKLQERTAFFKHSYETTILKKDVKFHKSVKTKKFSSYMLWVMNNFKISASLKRHCTQYIIIII